MISQWCCSQWDMLWVHLCGWDTAFVYLCFYSAQVHDPTIFQSSILSLIPLLFLIHLTRIRRMTGGKPLKIIKFPASSAHWIQCWSALISVWKLSHHLSSCPRLPAPLLHQHCTQGRQRNGFNLDNSSLSICGMCVNLLQFPGHRPLCKTAVEDKTLWSCPSKHTHPESGSKSQHNCCIFSHVLLYHFPVTHVSIMPSSLLLLSRVECWHQSISYSSSKMKQWRGNTMSSKHLVSPFRQTGAEPS